MKKRALSIALVLTLVFALVPVVTAPVAAAEFVPVTGWDMMEKLGAGITFANTTEARPWPWDDWKSDDTETCWGQPKIEQWHFKSVALKGFDSYRICVSWTPHMDENYIIDSAWLDRIQEITDWALEAGLNVVMNTHHEEELYWLIRDSKYDDAKKHLTAIWSQVAERFKDYPESLVFEIMNEPNLLEHYGGDGEWINVNGQISRVLCDTVNKLNADALDVIRSSGGYNDKRVVMLCMPGGSAATMPYMKMPDDPYAVFGAFGYDGAFFNSYISALIQQSLNKGIGFINKEDSMEVKPAEHYRELADMGVPSFWFTGCASYEKDFDSFNRLSGEWVNEEYVEAILGAYGKTPGPDLKTSWVPLPYEMEGPFHDKEYDTWAISKTISTPAEKMVVETTDNISWFKFSLASPVWTEYEVGDKRITRENGNIIFDLRGLSYTGLGFLTWNDGDAKKIKRVYLLGSELPNYTEASGWAHLNLQEAYNIGIVPEALQDKYTENTTRAEFCALSVALYEKLNGTISELKSFPDTTDVNIGKMGALGVIQGAGEGKANPDSKLTREQAATILARLADAAGKPLPAATSSFSDDNQISSWAKDAVGAVQAAGIMQGSSGRFNPGGDYTREQCILTILRLWNWCYEQ